MGKPRGCPTGPVCIDATGVPVEVVCDGDRDAVRVRVMLALGGEAVALGDGPSSPPQAAVSASSKAAITGKSTRLMPSTLLQ